MKSKVFIFFSLSFDGITKNREPPRMPAPHDLALSVEERAENQFFWVILEALSSDAAEAIHYSPILSAATPQSSYSSALALGASALRKLASSLARDTGL